LGLPSAGDAIPAEAKPDSAVAESSEAPPRHLRFFFGQGLDFGHGRKSENGLHPKDTLLLSLRQFPGAGRFTENLTAVSDVSVPKRDIQATEALAGLRYRRGGFSLGGEAGYAYTLYVSNRVNRAVKQKAAASADFQGNADISQTLVFDADSTWEWRTGGGYEDIAGAFRTWTGNTTVTKTLGDFEFALEASGYDQSETQSIRHCTGKNGNGKACTDSDSTSKVQGIASEADADWYPGDHAVSLSARLEFPSQPASARILTLGAGYSYSFFKWLDAGVHAQWERESGGTAPYKFWLVGIGTSVNL
jgi:hypothetical protein